ncbi:hypothetical protein MMC31_005654, partial [Peltigera leucophlebia]|nr:hypothetical protein [Peltigera leucophlebia]
LIHLEKANFVRHRGTKRSIDISHKNVTAKLKRSKSEAESAEEVRPVAKSIPIPTPEFNIPANLNDAHAVHLIIAEHMPGLPAQEGKFKSNNCISMQMLTTNNEGFQTTTAKSAPSNDGATYTSDNSEPFSPVTSTKRLRSCRSRRINEDKDDNKPFDPVTSTKRLCGRGNKHVDEDSKDSDSESQTATASPTASTKRLAKRKTANAAVYSNSSQKTETPTPATTARQLRSDSLIPVISTRSIRSYGSERNSTENNANSLAENPPHMSTTQHLRHRWSRRTVMESDSNESSADEKTDATLSVTLTQRLHKRNDNRINVINNPRQKTKTPLRVFAKHQGDKEKQSEVIGPQIKVIVPPASILPGSSNANFTKQKSTSLPVPSLLNLADHDPRSSTFNLESDKEQYTPSPSPDDQFATDDESDDRGNNAVATIEELFLNIGHRSSYERLTEKAVQETCEFFMHTPRHMTSNNWIALRGIRSGLRPF